MATYRLFFSYRISIWSLSFNCRGSALNRFCHSINVLKSKHNWKDLFLGSVWLARLITHFSFCTSALIFASHVVMFTARKQKATWSNVKLWVQAWSWGFQFALNSSQQNNKIEFDFYFSRKLSVVCGCGCVQRSGCIFFMLIIHT